MHQRFRLRFWPGVPARASAGARRRGFTLVELLVVIALIAILASLLLPALAGVKLKGQAMACLNNHRQLQIATLMYAHDANDTMPYNLGGPEIEKLAEQGEYWNWSSPIMSWEVEADNTNTALLVTGGIGPYTASSADLYRCPSDRVVSDLQADAGWSQRVRSTSMNAMIGNAGRFSESGANSNNPHYTQFFRLSQIPRPSRIFVMIEEHPDSIDDGYFLNVFYSRMWGDLPASWHGGSANLSFVDGHVELHKWQAASTRPAPRPASIVLPFRIPDPDLVDYNWLMDRTSVK